MTTTITPAAGSAPAFTQGGVGASPGYAALDFRRAFAGALQEGVMESGSYMVTQKAAGANLSVDIAANAAPAGNGAAAYVQGDAITGQGLYEVSAHLAVINEAITTAHATLPRVDRVVLEIQDNVHDGSGGNLARTRVVTGTATSGATLDNLTGATAVPSSCLLLADVLVGAGVTSVTNAVIRDRRKWARGAMTRIFQNGNQTRSSSTLAEIDSTNIKPRLEFATGVYRATLCLDVNSATAGKTVRFDVFLDGVAMGRARDLTLATANNFEPFVYAWEFDSTEIAAGSHRIAPAWSSVDNATVMGILAATRSIMFTVQELGRQDTANNTTTTG